jgi:hypothetical protein
MKHVLSSHDIGFDDIFSIILTDNGGGCNFNYVPTVELTLDFMYLFYYSKNSLYNARCAVSKSDSFIPIIILNSLEPWSIVRMLISASPIARNTLAAVPFAFFIPRPTTASSASESSMKILSGSTAVQILLITA